MKQGLSLSALATEIERQNEQKKDFLAPTQKLAMVDGKLNIDGVMHDVNSTAHGQIAARLKIPKVYYDTMLREQPALLDHNVNTWFTETPRTQLVRTLDGTARAFLSDKYRPLDNYDLMMAVLPILHEKKLKVVSCNVSDKKFYLKVVFPELERELKTARVGDIVQGGMTIGNSEIGHGTFFCNSFLLSLVCMNGMQMPTGMRKYHVGQKQIGEENIQHLLSDKTRNVNDAGFWMKVQDVVRASLNRDIFDKHCDILEDTTKVHIDVPAIEVVEKITKKYSLSDSLGKNIMDSLIKGGDTSQYGYAQAVTEVANNHNDYDEATDIESIGGKIITLSPKDWQSFAA